MYYAIGAIRYCFPFGTTQYVPLDPQHPSQLCGVLTPYVGKQLTEAEADDLLCELIKKHPLMEGAMHVDVHVMRHDGNVESYYQTITSRNYQHDQQKTRKPSPIRWR